MSLLDIRKYKETLLEFLGDVTTIPDKSKAWFLGEPEAKDLFDAPKGYKVLSPFLLVKVQESTRVQELPFPTIEEMEKDPEAYTAVAPQIEVYISQINIKLFTEDYTYIISANWRENSPQYLGCVIDSRKARAGEDWMRGNDMWDGHFCRETWNKIKDDIINNEMKGIAKYIVNGRYTREN